MSTDEQQGTRLQLAEGTEDGSRIASAPRPNYPSKALEHGSYRPALLHAGLLSFLGYCLFWALMQSQTLWAHPIALPGGESGVFGQIRHLFPQEWLQAKVGSGFGYINALLYLILLVFLFIVYVRALRLVFRPNPLQLFTSRRPLRLISGVTALILLVLLFVPGTMSADLHSYIWYGRILFDYGANPFIHAPAEFAARDAGGWLDLVYWKDVPSVYGPVWVWLAGGVAWLASLFGGDISLHLLGHKLLAGLAHMVNLFLVWRVAGLVIARYWRKPSFVSDVSEDDWRFGSTVGVTLFYAWNPLLLVEFGANGHNDALLLTFMLGGLWLYLVGRWRMAALAFALACMVKAVALLWWPGFLWLLFWQARSRALSSEITGVSSEGKAHRSDPGLNWRNPGWGGVGRILQAVAIAAAAWTICYVPFWEGVQTLHPLTGGPANRLFTNSLASLLRYRGGEWLHGIAVAQGWPALAGGAVDYTRVLIEGWIRWIALGMTFILALPYAWRGRTLPGMLKGWGWLLFFYLTIGAVWFWPWYVAWLVVPVALVGPGRLMTATLILCLTSLFLYVVYPQLPTSVGEILYWRALLTIAPAIVYVGMAYILQQKSAAQEA